MLTTAALEDVYRTYDYGFDDDAFSIASPRVEGGHVPQSIASYVANERPRPTSQTSNAQFPEDIRAWAYLL